MGVIERLTAALADRYRIERELGAGGMATVYLAEDLKHHRKVAVKVLRPELAAILGAERFLKEIEVTANLQHPNILPLFDSGEARVPSRHGVERGTGGETFLYYVMPFVEGESLRQRLDREQQLAVEDAVAITSSIAAALQYAHERDIVHRDIKPENVMLQAGQALVADFGIALAVTHAGGTRLTETGISMGTPHYMSPEQAAGDRALDVRSDVYSLGCITYEMLVGEPPHIGSSVQAVIAKVLSDTPTPITRSRELVPLNVDAAVQKALAKSPADRFDSAARFARALEDETFTLPSTGAMSAAARPDVIRWRRRAVTLGAVAVVMAAAALWGWLRPNPVSTIERQRVMLWAEPATAHIVGEHTALAPDGSAIAYIDTVDGTDRLFVKERARHRGEALLSVADPIGPFFSPDGEWIGVWTEGALQRIPRGGGAPVFVVDSVQRIEPAGAWLDDGSIVFVRNDRLMRVTAAGEVVVASDTTIPGLWYLAPLPGARGVLFSSCTGSCHTSNVQALDLRTGRTVMLFSDAVSGSYVETGHVIYVSPDGGAFAARLDLATMAVEGPTVRVLDGVATIGPSTHLNVTPGGTLLYVLGPQIAAFGAAEAVWVDRDGAVTPVDSGWTFRSAQESGVALSPDASMLAVVVEEDLKADVWVKQLPDGPFSRLTRGGGTNFRPTWTGEPGTLMYVSADHDGCELFVRNVDGVAEPRPQPAGHSSCIGRWSADNRWLVYREDHGPGTPSDIMMVRSDEGAESVPLAATAFHETSPELSPDGRWVAYASDESGRSEVYLRPFPDVQAGRWLVSAAGGSMPVWARDASELFFIDGIGQLTSARIDPGPPLSITRRTLFDMARRFAGVTNDRAGIRMFDVAPDGRFLAVRGVGSDQYDDLVDIVLVEHWLEELRERLPR